MSIRYLATELYKAIKKVEHLEERLKHATRENRGGIEAAIFTAARDRDHLRKMIETKKE